MSVGVSVAGLDRRLSAAVDAVEVADGARSASVAGQEVTAEGAAALRAVLSRKLYEVLHTGRDASGDAPARTLRDPETEAALTRATPHREVLVSGFLAAAPGGRVVELDGLRVRVPDDVPLTEGAEDVVRLRLPAVRPALSPGFFLADGSAGRPGPGAVLRVYVRVPDAWAARELWGAVLGALEERAVRHRAKVISHEGGLPRNDGLVVYLGPESYGAVGTVAEAAGRVAAGAGASVFARTVAPGVAVAWEPDDRRPGMRGLSFGEHRAAVLARELTDAAAAGRARPAPGELAEALRAANVDPLDPARNLDSGPWPALGRNLSFLK
ncbi:T3SS effector HopA1 family protein [Streptomyces sp. NBC_00847]|uniref:T3SS effector HopA1 family protein n=1 Tax=Streptomyces sp. NBC_00847 TaxID=2975850 RepID=UPI00225068C3|nr:T3SS effector HopA1 family protein [Streptomyces sp. NBC_00847]MCX4882356.1 T3SS effector HopA1 family protein [Streptomyces sp. NBC_00847]